MGRKKVCDEVFEESDEVPRNAANARERTRMRVLSKAFGRLKLTLPWVPPDTKLSKLDTLRLAMSYINHLQKTLEEEDGNVERNKEIAAPVKNKKCWPHTHPSVSMERKEETTNSLTKTFLIREEENSMVRGEDNIRERVREHNNNVNMWYSGEGVEKGSEG